MKKNVFKPLLYLVIFLATLVVPATLTAHDGPVDRDGCHYDGAGRFHCH